MSTAATGLTLMAMKQTLTVAQREELELSILANFDACRRGQGTNYGCNVVSKHLLIGQCIGSMKKNKKLYDLFAVGVKAISKASFRPGDTVSLTTGEYKDIRDALIVYLRAVLPVIEWKQLLGADAHVSGKLDIEPLEFLK